VLQITNYAMGAQPAALDKNLYDRAHVI